MAYKPNIPAATDKLSVSQGDIQGNFQAIDDGNNNVGFAFDHVGLTQVSNVGKHKQVTLIDQTSSVPTFTATDAGVYNADDVASGTGRRELWWGSTSGTVNYPITAGKRTVAGWSRIGGGIYLIWNSPTSDANTSSDTTLDLTHCPASGTILNAQVAPFPTSVSGTDNDYVVQITAIAATVTVGVFTKSASTATRLASKRLTYLVMRL